MDALREHDDELGCLVSSAGQARDGDVVALMTHQDREAVDRWLLAQRATRGRRGHAAAKVRAASETTAPPDPA